MTTGTGAPSAPTAPTAAFALLDDRLASVRAPTSRLYTDFAHERRCIDPGALDAVWAEVQADQHLGLHAVLLADYEWGTRLLHAGERSGSHATALRVLLFRELRHLSHDDTSAWLAAEDGQAEPGVAGTLDVAASVERSAFHAAIARIHEAIRAGETYQVNYTYRLDFATHGTPLALYRRLRMRQPVPYGAFIALPPDASDASAATHVLSCSPELFVRHQNGRLTAKPMKGTAPRRAVMEGDSETARLLSLDAKNRAENLMIVDLLRNDLGRIAKTGSVRVPDLFDIESHATVFQMTSTVEAELLPHVGLPELLRATFPCGSITGAPKHHTMELIAGLENTPRGLYTGAIGWVDVPREGAACGDLCLSVAIRTLTLGPEGGGLRAGRLGIGAGIVLDSEAEDEYAECQLKARFLTGLDPGFQLFETLYATRETGVRHRTLHLARLERSARRLGFEWDAARVDAALAEALQALESTTPMRLRLTLHHGGRVELRAARLTAIASAASASASASASAPASAAASLASAAAAAASALTATSASVSASAAVFASALSPESASAAVSASAPASAPAPSASAPSTEPCQGDSAQPQAALRFLASSEPAAVGLLCCAEPLPAMRPLAGHKTTLRAAYDAGTAAAEAAGAFDSLFFTADGRLVEGGRSNVFLRLSGQWYTPPLADGALPGIMRGLLLEDPDWAACERSLWRDDLRRAEAIVVCNALRGALPARLLEPGSVT